MLGCFGFEDFFSATKNIMNSFSWIRQSLIAGCAFIKGSTLCSVMVEESDLEDVVLRINASYLTECGKWGNVTRNKFCSHARTIFDIFPMGVAFAWVCLHSALLRLAHARYQLEGGPPAFYVETSKSASSSSVPGRWLCSLSSSY